MHFQRDPISRGSRFSFARMPRLLISTSVWVAVMVAGLATSGCRTLPRSSTWATAPGPDRLNDEELETRAQALAEFSAGVVEQSRDDNSAALERFVRALEKDPSNEPLALEVARRFLSRQQPDRAYEILKRSAALPAASSQVRVMVGMAAIQSGRVEAAAEIYGNLIHAEPEQLGHYAMLAQIRLQQKRASEALRVAEQATKQNSGLPTAWLDFAGVFGRIAQVDPSLRDAAITKAKECLARVEAAAPTDTAHLRRLAEGYLAVGEQDRAERLFVELAGKSGVDPQVAGRLAEIYLRTGRLDNARKQFQELERANPANPAPHYFLGIIAMEQRDFAQAQRSFERTILLNPEGEAAYGDLMAVQLSAGKAQEAILTREKARARFGPEFRREFLAGLAHSNLREFDRAQQCFAAAEKFARERAPQLLDHRFYYQFGSMLERAGRFDEAVAALEQSLNLKPDFDESLNHLGYMWAERGENLLLAHDMIQQAVKAEPENPAYLDSLGWVLFQLKNPAEALPWLQKAVKLLPEPDATVLDHLGDVLAALGKRDEAREAWRRSLEIEPTEAVRKKLEPRP
jgi:tetratricopeptide (TPR) repeat protein